MQEVAWYHSSGEVLMVEKKLGIERMGRWARVRGQYLKGIEILENLVSPTIWLGHSDNTNCFFFVQNSTLL
jgi:hypothetical protein